MHTIALTALLVGILYFLSRWAFATLDYAAAHPGKGRPEITWRITWWLAILVSAGSAASGHLFILGDSSPRGEEMAFNAIVFGGFLVGFLVTGHFDHRVRLRQP